MDSQDVRSTRMVLLRHTLSDGSAHFDWMMEVAGLTGLLTFRVGVRLDEEGAEEFVGVRLAEHRAVYLEYEGALSGGRGEVVRVARGACRVAWAGRGGVIRGTWEGGTGEREWVGRPGEGEAEWVFRSAKSG